MKRPKNVFSGVRGREIGVRRHCGSQKILRNHADFIGAKYSSKISPLNLPSNVRSTFLVTFSYDSALMGSTHGNHQIYVWRVRSGECIQTLVGHPRTPWTVMFHPHSREILASGCLGGEVRVWDLQGSSEVWCSPSRTTITSLTFHPRDRLLAIATGNQIYLWDWNEATPFTSVSTSSNYETVRLVRFDSLGHYLLTGIANQLAEYDQNENSNSDENTQDSSNQGSEESDPEPLEPDLYPAPSIPAPPLPSDAIQGAPGDGPIPRPLSPESMDTLEQAREYAATVTLNALRSRHQRGFDIVPSSANQAPINPPNYPPGFSQPLGYLTRYSLPLQEGGQQRRSGQAGGSSRERQRHSVDSLSNLANFASNPPTNSLSQVSQRLSNEFAMPQPAPVEAETVSPSSEEPQEIQIPSTDTSSTLTNQVERAGTSSRENPVMVEVEGEQIQVAVVTDTRAAPPPQTQPRGESAYLGRIPSRRPRSRPQSSESSSHHHAQLLRGYSLARYQAQLSRRSLPGNMNVPGRRFASGVPPDLPLPREGEDGVSGSEGPRRRRIPQLTRRSLQGQLNIPSRRYAPTGVGDQPLSRQGDDEGQSGEGLRRRRPSRFGFHRTALRRRVLHSHYSTSLFDNTQPPSPSVHYAINRAIANALAGRGQMAVANNISNRTHRLQWWDIADNVLPDISDAQSNVIVTECKIHNDASVDISSDRRLAAFIPSHLGFPDHGVLAVCSLEKHNLGQVLFTKSFGPNAITVSLSPSGNYILVGLAARRLHWQMFHGLMADVYQLQKPEAGEDSMTFINRIIHPIDHQQRLVVSVNIARWIPSPGAGLVYGTNRGDLCFCTPKLDNEDEPVVCEGTSTSEGVSSEGSSRQLDMIERRRSYRELGVMAVRLSNAQTGTSSGQTSRQSSVSQSTQTGNNVVQNMGTQTDFGNEGHVAGRERIAERRSDMYEALRSGTMLEGRDDRRSGEGTSTGDRNQEAETSSRTSQQQLLSSNVTVEDVPRDARIVVSNSREGNGEDELISRMQTDGELHCHGDGYPSRRIDEVLSERNSDEGRSQENSLVGVGNEVNNSLQLNQRSVNQSIAAVSRSFNSESQRLASSNLPTYYNNAATSSYDVSSSAQTSSSPPTGHQGIQVSSHSCRMLDLAASSDSNSSTESDSTPAQTNTPASSGSEHSSAFHMVGPGGDAGSSLQSNQPGRSPSTRATHVQSLPGRRLTYGLRMLNRATLGLSPSLSPETELDGDVRSEFSLDHHQSRTETLTDREGPGSIRGQDSWRGFGRGPQSTLGVSQETEHDGGLRNEFPLDQHQSRRDTMTDREGPGSVRGQDSWRGFGRGPRSTRRGADGEERRSPHVAPLNPRQAHALGLTHLLNHLAPSAAPNRSSMGTQIRRGVHNTASQSGTTRSPPGDAPPSESPSENSNNNSSDRVADEDVR